VAIGAAFRECTTLDLTDLAPGISVPPTILPKEVIRATEEEKEAQIATVENVQQAYAEEGKAALRKLQEAAIRNENMFEVLMEATKYCSLGQLTAAMFEVGGQYRRNM
jgi:methylmalonyl-CoA mutase